MMDTVPLAERLSFYEIRPLNEPQGEIGHYPPTIFHASKERMIFCKQLAWRTFTVLWIERADKFPARNQIPWLKAGKPPVFVCVTEKRLFFSMIDRYGVCFDYYSEPISSVHYVLVSRKEKAIRFRSGDANLPSLGEPGLFVPEGLEDLLFDFVKLANERSEVNWTVLEV